MHKILKKKKTYLCSILISVCIDNTNKHTVNLQVFDWMQKNDEVNFASYSSFIKYMGISQNPMKALQVYDNIRDKSMKINVSVCNSILGCLVRNGRFESSIKLFDKMKDDGLSPDLVTYSTVCNACSITMFLLLIIFYGVICTP